MIDYRPDVEEMADELEGKYGDKYNFIGYTGDENGYDRIVVFEQSDVYGPSLVEVKWNRFADDIDWQERWRVTPLVSVTFKEENTLHQAYDIMINCLIDWYDKHPEPHKKSDDEGCWWCSGMGMKNIKNHSYDGQSSSNSYFAKEQTENRLVVEGYTKSRQWKMESKRPKYFNAYFEINYCPMCGRKLKKEGE